MFVYWEHYISNGLTKDGKDMVRFSQSSVHKDGECFSYKTHCKMKIPKDTQLSITLDAPIGRKLCKRCFPDATV